MDTPKEWIDAGAWVGRQQAFAVIASQCRGAQAVSLKHVKQSRWYQHLSLTWEEFCREYAGIGRTRADNVIRRLDEFGESYFRLSEIARISPETYRQIAGRVHGGVIKIDGRQLALTQENALKIRAAIRTLLSKLRPQPNPKASRRSERRATQQAREIDYVQPVRQVQHVHLKSR
jgi:hypothetical protein